MLLGSAKLQRRVGNVCAVQTVEGRSSVRTECILGLERVSASPTEPQDSPNPESGHLISVHEQHPKWWQTLLRIVSRVIDTMFAYHVFDFDGVGFV